MKSFKEYKERKEAEKFFRQNNDQFLSADQWVKTIFSGLISAIVVGLIHGVLMTFLSFDFSFFYIVMGIAVANVLNSSSGVESPQIGIASAVCTIISFIVSNLVIAIQFVPFPMCIPVAFTMFLSNDILGWIFIAVGLFAAYFQGSENRFM